MKSNLRIWVCLLLSIMVLSRCKKAKSDSPINPVSPTPVGEYTVSTLAGTLQAAFVNGPTSSARFSFPSFIAADPMGNVYVADRGNNVIRKITALGEVTTFAGSGANGSQDGLGVMASFRVVEGLATDVNGNIYVSNYCNIRKVSPAGLVTTIAGSNTQGYQDGQDTAARFSWVYGLTVDILGNVYVVDNGLDYSRVRKVTPSGLVTTVAGGTKGSADGSVSSAKFSYLLDIVADTVGNLIVNDIGNHSLRKVTVNGQVSTIYKRTTVPFEPQYLTTDPNGVIYLTQSWWASGTNNSFNSIYRLINGTLSKIVGAGESGYKDGNGDEAKFNDNWGLAFDPQGNLLVADRGNHCIRKIKKN